MGPKILKVAVDLCINKFNTPNVIKQLVNNIKRIFFVLKISLIKYIKHNIYPTKIEYR